MSSAMVSAREPIQVLADVSAADWERLGSRRIFFGHQSVGADVIQGIRDLMTERPALAVRIVEASEAVGMSEPGLYHARIGRNGSPDTKVEEFVRAAAGLGEGGIALMKYCYVDVTVNTDATSLFETYRRAIDALKASRPDLSVVHVTMPLMADPGTVRHVAAVLRGRPTHRHVNRIREQYNERLRQTYGGRDVVFDLARLESTREDGSEATVRFGGTDLPVLATEWTYDGGHLNEAGRRRAAAALLTALASVQGVGE